MVSSEGTIKPVDTLIIADHNSIFEAISKLFYKYNLSQIQTDEANVALFTIMRDPDVNHAVALYHSWRMGVAATAFSLIDALRRFRPKEVFSVGLAIALSDDLQIGDVILPKKIGNWVESVGIEKGQQADFRTVYLDARLLHRATSLNWHGQTIRDQDQHHAPRVRTTDVLTATNVISAESVKKRLPRGFGAIDMEGFVVADLIAFQSRPTPLLIIRGVSDVLGGERVDGKSVAVNNVASFVQDLLLSAPISKVSAQADVSIQVSGKSNTEIIESVRRLLDEAGGSPLNIHIAKD
jgi:nucleoside phosphorylase